MKKDLISVIIPCYNVERFLDDLFQCIDRQTIENFEVVFINDGSTDGTLKKLKEFCSTNERYRLIDQKNQGVSQARNNGLAVAEGEFVTFMDSDDMVGPQHLESLFNLIKKYDSDLSINQRCFVKENFDIRKIKSKRIKQNEIYYSHGTEEYLSWYITKTWGYGVFTKLYRMAILQQMPNFPNLFNSKSNYGEDIEFNVKYIQLIKDVVYLNQVFYYHRNRKGSLVKSGFKANKLGVFNGIDEVLKLSETKYPNLKTDVRSCKAIFSMEMLYRMGESKYDDYEKIAELYKFLKENKKFVFKCNKNNFFQRIFFNFSVPYVRNLNKKALKTRKKER